MTKYEVLLWAYILASVVPFFKEPSHVEWKSGLALVFQGLSIGALTLAIYME